MESTNGKSSIKELETFLEESKDNSHACRSLTRDEVCFSKSDLADIRADLLPRWLVTMKRLRSRPECGVFKKP
jgi:hypothetical protein